jgi:hypothetical protein
MIHPMRLLAFLVTINGAFANEPVPYLPYEFDPAKWPEAHLRLSEQGTLKDVFDSGLRPYRHPGLENSLLQVKHLSLTIHLASGKILPQIPAELIDVTPFDDGAIATLEGFTPKLTLGQAREEMLRWLPYAENGRTEVDLDEYLKVVEADFLDFDDPYRGISHGCSVGWSEPGWKTQGGGPQCGFWFRKTASETHPLRLYFNLSWSLNRLPRDRSGYSVPIPPPPGYEHVSMDAPKNFGPDSAADILRAKGMSIGESPQAREKWRREAMAYGWVPPEASPEPPRPAVETVETENPRESQRWLWWFAAAVVAWLLAFLGIRLRRTPSTP